MLFEMSLTVILACFVFIEREIKYSIAYIIGNNIYKNALEGLTKKKFSWYIKNSAPLTAHKINKVPMLLGRTMTKFSRVLGSSSTL
jgi:hypothetical protein